MPASVDPSTLESANWWFDFSSRWLLVVGVIAATAACLTVALAFIQWRTERVPRATRRLAHCLTRKRSGAGPTRNGEPPKGSRRAKGTSRGRQTCPLEDRGTHRAALVNARATTRTNFKARRVQRRVRNNRGIAIDARERDVGERSARTAARRWLEYYHAARRHRPDDPASQRCDHPIPVNARPDSRNEKRAFGCAARSVGPAC